MSPGDRSAFRAAVEAADGAREALAATVGALKQPDTCQGEAGAIETIETHMSFVFLTERFAYKLKKPLRTSSLDYTTVEARRRACDTELELNRRLARDVYLAVVPVVDAGGDLQLDGAGTPVDWLVKMHRLPRARMLDAGIERGTVGEADVDKLATVLSRFYASAARAGVAPSAYRLRTEVDLGAKQASLAQPHYGLRQADLRAVAAGQARWLAEHRDLLEARASLVVDAHGDLRPEHVCLQEPRPAVIDCLEFDRSLRLLDPVSELGFLALECRRLGAGWIGPRLLERYAETSGDRTPTPLLPFYQSHHALVRAAIAVWHLDDEALDHSDRWRERGNSYLQIARTLV